MIKTYIIPVTLSIIIAVTGALIYTEYKKENSVDVLKQYNLTPLECDLFKTRCEKEFMGGKIIFDMQPRPVEIMAETTISLEGLNYDFNDPKIRIFGINMDMGTIIASLHKEGNRYTAKVALSACLVEDIMRYRLSVYDGNDSLGLFMDFDIPR